MTTYLQCSEWAIYVMLMAITAVRYATTKKLTA
ncbi:Uncharacterised protein [Vibrio cholerae]|nr:Uncharacterised protein [Vibrio cholerae]